MEKVRQYIPNINTKLLIQILLYSVPTIDWQIAEHSIDNKNV